MRPESPHPHTLPAAAAAAVLAAVAAVASPLLGCGGGDDGGGGGDDDTAIDYRAGGATTVKDRSSNAYSLPAANLAGEELDRHRAGDAAFEATFVTGGAPVNNGLGPLYNNTACDRCHGKDGRGLPLIGVGPTSQSLVRVSLPEGEPEVPGGPVPVPGMGTQVQNHAVYGRDPEARVALAWDEQTGAYDDGTEYTLRAPRLAIERVDGESLDGVLTSLREPPPVFGLGLLEAIDDETIEAREDPDDADGDGISGRVNRVWDVATGAAALGRFGHKANQPSLLQQAAAAYANDMGISSPIFPDEGGATDISLDIVELTAFYTSSLAVPAPATLTPEAERGQELFSSFGCGGCHVTEAETGDHELAIVSRQAIEPYTDLLLHDMGEGLADGRPDFLASGSEWRTAPLWGIGLVQTVQPGSGYLHDGRARTIAEAILWHGGEAEASRERFRRAAEADRAALLSFLGSL